MTNSNRDPKPLTQPRAGCDRWLVLEDEPGAALPAAIGAALARVRAAAGPSRLGAVVAGGAVIVARADWRDWFDGDAPGAGGG